MAIEIVNEIAPNANDWEIIKEVNLLNTAPEILYRNFNLLSGGEQVKILLIGLFLKENNFLLIDEPTNHLDSETRNNLVHYLEKKKGFILVSHDRNFLDKVVDHIIAINNTNIEIMQGNFSNWKENKEKKDNFEIMQNEKLQKDIDRLEIASKNSAKWSDEAENGKKKKYNSETTIDKGFVGHKASKMMKRSKVMEQRIEKAINEKTNLLRNVDRNEPLKIIPLVSNKTPLVLANNLKISYVSQSTEGLKGELKAFSRENKIDESIFKAMLVKMGFAKEDFDKNIQDMSEGQKKKVLIAKSISEQANIYIWDEPLNYIDILTRIQIEESILNCKPTLIFVEHDETFIKKVSTKIINLENCN